MSAARKSVGMGTRKSQYVLKSPLSGAAKSQKVKAQLDPSASMLLPLETYWYNLNSSAIDVLETVVTVNVLV